MVVYEKIYFEAYITNTFDKKVLHNYILYYREPTYNKIFSVDLGMLLIFTDFQKCKGLRPTSCWKIYQ